MASSNIHSLNDLPEIIVRSLRSFHLTGAGGLLKLIDVAARSLRLLAGRLLILLFIGFLVVLICQLPLLTRFEQVNPPEPPVVHFQPEVYWEQVTGFPARALAGNDLHQFLQDAWWRSAVGLGTAFAVALLVGTVVGVATAVTVGGKWQRPLLAGTLLSMAVPDFIIVALVQRLVVFLYRHFDFKLFPIISDMSPRGWVLPGLALGLLPAAYVARITAIALDDIYRQDYIRTARAKGVHPFIILFGHALRNAIPRIAAALPQGAAFAISALLPVEWLTNWPGLGFRVVLGIDPRNPVASVDRLAAAGLALVATYLLLDSATRVLAAALGSKTESTEAEGMV